MPFKKTILSAALLKVIEKEVDKLYDKAIVRYLGPWALDKVIFFGSKKEQEKWEKENIKPFMTLPGLVTASALQNGGQPSEELTEQLIDNVKEYFDAYRAQTKAQVRARVQNFVREAAISGKEVDPKVVLGGQLTDVWKGATAQAKRLVDTESTTARNLGGLEGILEISKKQGIDDPVVAFLSIKDKHRCLECTRLHTLEDGVTPRVWKLSEVGHGYHKKGEPNPKIGGLHPNCRCSQIQVLPGYGFDSSGKIVYKGENWNELKHQRGLEKSIVYEPHECDALEKVSPPPNFKKLGVEPRQIPVISTPTQAESKAATVANASLGAEDEDRFLPPAERTEEDKAIVSRSAKKMGEALTEGFPGHTGYVAGYGQTGYALGKPLLWSGLRDDNYIEGTAQHESLHAMLNRVEEKHGPQARQNLVENLFWSIPSQLQVNVGKLHALQVPVESLRKQPPHVRKEEAIARVLNHMNSSVARMNFHSRLAKIPDHNPRQFDDGIKQAYKAIRAAAEVADHSWLTELKRETVTPPAVKVTRMVMGKSEDNLQKSDRKTSDYLAELARYGWEPTGRSSKHITLTNKLFPATRPLAISHSEAKRISVNNMENNAKDAGLIWDYSGMRPDPKHPYAEHYIKHGLLEPPQDAPKTWKPKDHDGQLMEIGKVLSLKPDVHLDWRTAKHLSTFKTSEDHSSIAPVKVMDGGDGNFYAEEGDEQLEAARAHGFTHVPVVMSDEAIQKSESELLAKMALIHDDEKNPITVYRVQRADGMGPYNTTYALGFGGDKEKENRWFNLPVPGKDKNFTTTPIPSDDFMPNEFRQIEGGRSPLHFAFEKPEHAEEWFGRDWLEGAKEFGFELTPVKAKKVYRSLSGRQLMYLPHEDKTQKKERKPTKKAPAKQSLKKSTPEGISTLHNFVKPKALELKRDRLHDHDDETVRRVADRLASAPIAVHLISRKIPDIIRDGRLKNLFETGHGLGALDPRVRREWEANQGIPLDHPPHLRPLYGALHVFDDHREAWEGPAPTYGDVYLKLHPHVKERSTFTPEDSSLSQHPHLDVNVHTNEQMTELAHRLLKEPAQDSWVRNERGDYLSYLATDGRLGRSALPQDLPYVEAQIHGGVDLQNDVASVHVTGYREETLSHAKALGQHFNLPVFARDKVIYDPNEKPATPEMEQPVEAEKKVG